MITSLTGLTDPDRETLFYKFDSKTDCEAVQDNLRGMWGSQFRGFQSMYDETRELMIPLNSVLAACVELSGGSLADVWEAWVYPDRSNLLDDRSVGAYSTLSDCRTAALAVIETGGWTNTADYECGLNCDSRLGPDGPRVCDETGR